MNSNPCPTQVELILIIAVLVWSSLWCCRTKMEILLFLCFTVVFLRPKSIASHIQSLNIVPALSSDDEMGNWAGDSSF